MKNNKPGRAARPKKHPILRVALPVAAAAAITYFCIGLYSPLQISAYTVASARLPSAFNGYKIIVISDLHNKTFGAAQQQLAEAVRAQQPDLIVLAGDMVSRKHKDAAPVEALLQALQGIAPMYSVPGNHELDNANLYTRLKKLYVQYGVTELFGGKSVKIERGGQHITLYGSRLTVSGQLSETRRGYRVNPALAPGDASGYNLLLHHFGSEFDTVSTLGFDLVLAGHVHGGVVRLPLVGGVASAEQGLFPEYDKGLFEKNGRTMVLSAGLGDTAFPRVYNHRDLVVVTLQSE